MAFLRILRGMVKTPLVQDLAHLRIEGMRRRFGNRFGAHTEVLLLRFPSAHRHVFLDATNILEVTCLMDFYDRLLNKTTRGASERLLGAILVQKSEHVIGPNNGSKIAKGMAISRGSAIRGVNLHFVRLARGLHQCRKSLARRQVIVVGGLEKENWRLGVSHCTSHNQLQFGRLRPTLSSRRGSDRRTIIPLFRAEHRLNATKRVAGGTGSTGPASIVSPVSTSRHAGFCIPIRRSASSRHDLRQEPYAVALHVRICAGGGQ